MGSLVNERAIIEDNRQVGPRLHLMVLSAPEIAGDVGPGQFVHMKLPRMDDHILRRPFSVYAADPEAGTIEVLYQVVGFGSEHMTNLRPGEAVEMIGPVGHGWAVPDETRRALIVAGGVGAAPLFMLTQQLAARGVQVDVVLGAQTEEALVCRDRYQDLLGFCPACATDDGSFGRKGFCTSLVDDALLRAKDEGEPYDYLAVCGPEPLMKIVADKAREAGVYAQVSMEKRMACGVGACLSCVVDTVAGKKRSCVDGPVFDAQEVLW